MFARQLLRTWLPRSARLFLRDQIARRSASLSQVGQDFWVFGESFDGKRGGCFLEIGAADGISLSNTFLLEKRYGWRGVCIEADPDAILDLRYVRRAKCLNICVDARDGEVDFVQRAQLGGIIGDDTDNQDSRTEVERGTVVRMAARSLHSVLRSENAPHVIDYLSIDVEGAEDRILCEFPFDEYVFNCMTVERPKDRLREVLIQNGYKVIREIPGLDGFYIHESFEGEYLRNVYSFWQRRSGIRQKRATPNHNRK